MALLAEKRTEVTTFPVIEVFGPTIQGEGAEAGFPCHFVRFGGCDYRCSWCDTMYAVDPDEVRRNSSRLTTAEITERIERLDGAPTWVVLSGGNPALHELTSLVDALQALGHKVAVETQGSVWRDWLGTVDRLTISPKPPSSGMDSEAHREQFQRFMAKAVERGADGAILKIVCFDEVDVRWASDLSASWPAFDLYLSAGTPVPAPADLRQAVTDRFRWLCERTAGDERLANARVLPQLHVLAWGDARGV
ncbi:MAG: 7-carboxy-7-deazaguanine synthase [Solirubrobacterales bacterium]|jgi:7-carboxy-7-deazaguanine synthase|nr:7-carboxy-7-deazaguanine synthase [Solirubrobacterales bacterium]